MTETGVELDSGEAGGETVGWVPCASSRLPCVSDDDIFYRTWATPYLDYGIAGPNVSSLSEPDSITKPFLNWELITSSSSLELDTDPNSTFSLDHDLDFIFSFEPTVESSFSFLD